jgi:hypothetical protein
MNPAKSVIAIFQGVRPLARLLNIDPSVVSRWQAPKKRRGTGGLIPAAYQGPLLKLARQKRLPLTAADLIKP